MKIRNTLIFILLSTIASMAQKNIQSPTLEDLIPGGYNYYKYRVSFPHQIQWWGDIPICVKGDSIVTIPITENFPIEMITDKNTLNSGFEDKEKIKTLGDISFPYPEKTIIMLDRKDKLTLYDFKSNTILANYNIPKEASNKDFSKGCKILAYTKDNNLYVLGGSGNEIAITSDTNKNIVNGQAVHRNEFGINKGTFWSPEGKYLAFYRMDESMVTDYPLVDISTRIAELKDIKYPMAGMKSHHVTVGIFNPGTEKTVFLKTGTPKEKYLTNIAWSPDEKYIYIAELNRGQDTCKLVRYSIESGKPELTLFTETHSKYIEPEHPVLFVKNNPDLFIWQSKRDGFNHLYLYDTKGILNKQLTSGKWNVTDIIGFDENGDYLYYVSTEVSPLDRHIYKLNIKNGKSVKISHEEGVHHAMLSDSGKYILDLYSSQYNPGKIVITDTKEIKHHTYFVAKDPYRNVVLPEITLASLKADDGKTDLYYRLVKPANFDPGKKYPVIIYVYGGPKSQMIDNSWMGMVRGWDIFMAGKGYVVFTLDNRGTNYRGLDFENVTHRQLGIVETRDQMAGVEFLKSLPYVDTERIGVHGWSYGGFMTLNLMLRHPDTFKVGVAGGPVTDWKYYEIMYGERYMDSPQENPEGYSNTSMLNKAGNLKGRLLLIHGDEDPTVVMQHSLSFLKSAIKNGTHPDFFVYPGHGHNMTGRDRVHLHEHITRYFDDFLK